MDRYIWCMGHKHLKYTSAYFSVHTGSHQNNRLNSCRQSSPQKFPPPFPHFHNSKVLVENLIKSGMCGTHLFQGFLACICKTAGRILGHGQFHRVWLLQRSRDSGLKGGKSEGISLTPRFVSKCHRKNAGSSLLSHIFLGVLDGIRGVDPLRWKINWFTTPAGE